MKDFCSLLETSVIFFINFLFYKFSLIYSFDEIRFSYIDIYKEYKSLPV